MRWNVPKSFGSVWGPRPVGPVCAASELACLTKPSSVYLRRPRVLSQGRAAPPDSGQRPLRKTSTPPPNHFYRSPRQCALTKGWKAPRLLHKVPCGFTRAFNVHFRFLPSAQMTTICSACCYFLKKFCPVVQQTKTPAQASSIDTVDPLCRTLILEVARF